MSKAADYNEALKNFLRGRDGNYVCAGCGGDIKIAGERNGRIDFACDGCGQKLRECTVCHFPRSIWGDDGDICSCCALDAMTGRKILTKEQIRGINQWRVIVRSPVSC